MVRHPNRPRDGHTEFCRELARARPTLTFGRIAAALSRLRRRRPQGTPPSNGGLPHAA